MFDLKPLIALFEKGVDFTSHYVDPLDFAQPPIPGLNLEAENNPEINGPVLVDRDETISESFFMLEYIDEAYPQAPRLLPGDPEGNWQVRVWGRLLGERTAPAIATLGCHKFLTRRLGAPVPDAEALLRRFSRQEARDAWRPALENGYTEEDVAESRRKAADAVSRVEEALAAGDWLLGAVYSIADIEAFALLNGLPGLAPDLLDDAVAPRTLAWLGRMRDRPAVKQALALSKTGRPAEAFAPGPEHARWG
jgi:glutathione S-transferase